MQESDAVRWLAAPVLLLAVLAIAVVGGYQVAYAGRIFPGVQALGVDLGGRTPDEANAALGTRADALLAAPVTIVAGDTVRRTTWRDVGLRLDGAALRD